jgi:hypothetical protein
LKNWKKDRQEKINLLKFEFTFEKKLKKLNLYFIELEKRKNIDDRVFFLDT